MIAFFAWAGECLACLFAGHCNVRDYYARKYVGLAVFDVPFRFTREAASLGDSVSRVDRYEEGDRFNRVDLINGQAVHCAFYPFNGKGGH